MTVGREELNTGNSIRVSRPAHDRSAQRLPFVDALVRKVALGVLHRLHIGGVDNPRPSQIVLLLLSMELGRRLVDRDACSFRLEGIDRRLLVLGIGAHNARTDPLRLMPRGRAHLAHLPVLRPLQPHALPLGHFSLLFRGHSILLFSAVACPRTLPAIHIARYSLRCHCNRTISRRLSVLL